MNTLFLLTTFNVDKGLIHTVYESQAEAYTESVRLEINMKPELGEFIRVTPVDFIKKQS